MVQFDQMYSISNGLLNYDLFITPPLIFGRFCRIQRYCNILPVACDPLLMEGSVDMLGI